MQCVTIIFVAVVVAVGVSVLVAAAVIAVSFDAALKNSRRIKLLRLKIQFLLEETSDKFD